MFSAVVNAFDQPPRYQEFDRPTPSGPHDVRVDVLGAGLHPRVRSQADGSHYTSTDELPLVPGIDGVGRLPDGQLVYFILPDTVMGSMAEQTVIDRRRSIALPAGADPLRIAAAMNPAMSSWVALRRRIEFQAGQRVLILGATGSAGQLAIQVARQLGAGEIIAAGRNQLLRSTLPGLGADVVVGLDGDPNDVLARLGRAGRDVDVVIDYLWGAPAAAAMTALITDRTDRGKALSWIQIGSVAGATAAIPSAALRAANLRILGSGQGSVSTADILAELPLLASRISDGTLAVDAVGVPLSRVEAIWNEATGPGQRVVLCPGGATPTIQAR
jgi:NADPH:quinone reductase-like Zn-dependent oxidoreductase